MSFTRRIGVVGMLTVVALVALALLGRRADAAPAPQAAEVTLTATLVGGAEEVPNPGDPDGTGTSTVTLRTGTNQVCWETRVSNITLPAAASHIHRGARGVAGPVVVPFTAPDANGRASDCASAEASLISEIAQNPAGFYVNVHTSDFPGGAVRGQLAGGAPATPAPAGALPSTGLRAGPVPLLAGLVLLALAGGLGLSWSVRRRTGAR